MKLTFNWGWGIGLVYALFAAGIIYLVTLCTHQNIDLVSNNYYEKEIQYQQQYNKEKNALALAEPLQLNINSSDKKIDLVFPESKKGAQINGQIVFQKPDNAKMDRTISISTQNLTQEVSFKD